MTDRPVQSRHGAGADRRHVVRRRGAQSGCELVEHQLRYAWHELGCVAQQLKPGAGGDGAVKPALLLCRADHVAAIAARDDVRRPHPDHARQQTRPGRIVQAQDLSLDRTDRRRAGAGMPPIAPVQLPAAITTSAVAISVPSRRTTPVTRSPPALVSAATGVCSRTLAPARSAASCSAATSARGSIA